MHDDCSIHNLALGQLPNGHFFFGQMTLMSVLM
jgi:hypothetical protein